MKVPTPHTLSDRIPENGTKDPSMELENFSKENFTIAPAYNKGALQLITKDNIKHIGKK